MRSWRALPRLRGSAHGYQVSRIPRSAAGAVPRFPYHVVYLELPDRLQILAVAHDRRRPGYWKTRVYT